MSSSSFFLTNFDWMYAKTADFLVLAESKQRRGLTPKVNRRNFLTPMAQLSGYLHARPVISLFLLQREFAPSGPPCCRCLESSQHFKTLLGITMAQPMQFSGTDDPGCLFVSAQPGDILFIRRNHGARTRQRMRLGQHRALMLRRNRNEACLLYTSPSPRDRTRSRMPSSA